MSTSSTPLGLGHIDTPNRFAVRKTNSIVMNPEVLDKRDEDETKDVIRGDIETTRSISTTDVQESFSVATSFGEEKDGTINGKIETTISRLLCGCSMGTKQYYQQPVKIGTFLLSSTSCGKSLPTVTSNSSIFTTTSSKTFATKNTMKTCNKSYLSSSNVKTTKISSAGPIHHSAHSTTSANAMEKITECQKDVQELRLKLKSMQVEKLLLDAEIARRRSALADRNSRSLLATKNEMWQRWGTRWAD